MVVAFSGWPISRSEQDAGPQEADRDADIVERGWTLVRRDPGGEDGGPQRRGRIEDARQPAADGQFTEADPEPGQRAAEDGHRDEGEEAVSGARGEGRLPAGGQDDAERESAEERTGQHDRRRA